MEHFDAATVHVLAPLIAVMGIETALMAVDETRCSKPLKYLVWGMRIHIVVTVFVYEDQNTKLKIHCSR